MNTTRKSTLTKATSAIRSAIAEAEAIMGELQEQYDGMSEKAQEGERGEAIQQEINGLEDAINSLSEGVDNIESIINS